MLDETSVKADSNDAHSIGGSPPNSSIITSSSGSGGIAGSSASISTSTPAPGLALAHSALATTSTSRGDGGCSGTTSPMPAPSTAVGSSAVPAAEDEGDGEDDDEGDIRTNADGSKAPDSAARLARLARKAESARLARLRHKQFVQEKQAEVSSLQREEEQLVAAEGPASLAALATVREELKKTLSVQQMKLLGDWLQGSPAGAPLVEMYIAQEEAAATAKPALSPLPPLDSTLPLTTGLAVATTAGLHPSNATSQNHESTASPVARGLTEPGVNVSDVVGSASASPGNGTVDFATTSETVEAASGEGCSTRVCNHAPLTTGSAGNLKGNARANPGNSDGCPDGDLTSNHDGPGATMDVGSGSNNMVTPYCITSTEVSHMSAPSSLAHATPESLGCASWAAAAAMAAAAAAAAATAAANSSEAHDANRSALMDPDAPRESSTGRASEKRIACVHASDAPDNANCSVGRREEGTWHMDMVAFEELKASSLDHGAANVDNSSAMDTGCCKTNTSALASCVDRTPSIPNGDSNGATNSSSINIDSHEEGFANSTTTVAHLDGVSAKSAITGVVSSFSRVAANPADLHPVENGDRRSSGMAGGCSSPLLSAESQDDALLPEPEAEDFLKQAINESIFSGTFTASAQFMGDTAQPSESDEAGVNTQGSMVNEAEAMTLFDSGEDVALEMRRKRRRMPR
mmetsp:Transcript_37100/g.98255  ORF Transcript_37100/g.98255 Transcript_37100/m.98255 type:complete len:693 (+) Transcript_37100:74-2152(+)